MGDDLGDSDSSWRVRRGAIQLLDTLLKNRKEMIKEISSEAIPGLVRRLREKDENVRFDTFNALNNYFKAVVYEDINPIAVLEDSQALSLIRMKSSVSNVGTVTENLIYELITLMKSNTSNNVKAAAANLLFTASLCAPHVMNNIIDNVFPLFIDFLDKENNSSANTDIKVNLLLCLRRILRGHADSPLYMNKYWMDILNICLKCIKNDYFKISSEGFRLLSALFKILRPTHSSSPQNYPTFVKPILHEIIKKLKEHDIDQEVAIYF